MTAARVASDSLTRALITATSKGLRPDCSDAVTGGLWLSEHEAEGPTPPSGGLSAWQVIIPRMSVLVAILTVLGGALSLLAAGIVFRHSRRARQREREVAEMKEEFSRKNLENDRAFLAYDQKARRYEKGESGTKPVAPFGGMTQSECGAQVQSWYRDRHKELLGYEPGEPPVAEPFLAKLIGPAVMAGVGVVISTGASVWSLYLQ